MPERIIRPGILTSDAVCSLSFAAEVFYRRLMSVVDDFGRYDGRCSILRASLYPLQLDKVAEPDIAKWRHETAKAGLVRVYALDGKEYVQLEKFNQRMRAAVSKWPSPPSSAGGCPQPHDNAIGGGDGIGDDKNAPSLPTRGRPKTVEELIAYGKSPHCGLPEAQCREMWVHYQTNGWTINGVPIADWQSAAVKWKNNQGKHEQRNYPKSGGGQRSAGSSESDRGKGKREQCEAEGIDIPIV